MTAPPLTPPQVAHLEGEVRSLLPHLDLSALDGQRLFVTGGTGFFGLWLLTAWQVLREAGIACEVTVLSRDPARFLARCPQFRDRPWLTFVTGDVRSVEIPSRRFDLVVHGATETTVAAHADAERMFDDLVTGARQIVRLTERSGARRLLLLSSGAVYGPQPAAVTHLPEDTLLACDPLRASSGFGEGKRVMELLGAMLQERTGVTTMTARCFSFCGPGLPWDGQYAIGNFIRDALTRDRITVQGDGSPQRSYLYGADLALWLLRILAAGAGGTAYHVGSDEAISIRALAERVRDLLAPGKPIEVLGAGSAVSAMRPRYVPAITRARALGCAPWTTLDEGIVRTAMF